MRVLVLDTDKVTGRMCINVNSCSGTYMNNGELIFDGGIEYLDFKLKTKLEERTIIDEVIQKLFKTGCVDISKYGQVEYIEEEDGE